MSGAAPSDNQKQDDIWARLMGCAMVPFALWVVLLIPAVPMALYLLIRQGLPGVWELVKAEAVLGGGALAVTLGLLTLLWLVGTMARLLVRDGSPTNDKRKHRKNHGPN